VGVFRALVPASRRSEGERRLALLSWLWIATIVVFFSLSRSKRSPYILPIAPAIALMAGEVALAFVSGVSAPRSGHGSPGSPRPSRGFVLCGAAILAARSGGSRRLR